MSPAEDVSPDGGESVGLTDSPVSVSFRNVAFAYEKSEASVLRNITLEIPRGSQAAFIGVSGAGKSTIADLLLGILEPSSGDVLIDGAKPRYLVSKSPGVFGYVPQSPGMISGTIAENIALGCEKHDIDGERLSSAIRESNLTSLVESLPLGVNSDIGNRKDELSGGQIQRIGLARALYHRPRLLVLDEATSALDAESENEINRALDGLRGQVTVIMIAHRLNTIQRSDAVFLVHEGEVTGGGLFSELIRSNKTVKRLAELMEIDPNPK
jgi:ATP-binding cassette subfamily C protein